MMRSVGRLENVVASWRVLAKVDNDPQPMVM